MTKLLIHFHLYYTDQLDYFLEKLSNIQGCDYDLYVTMVEKNADAEEKISRLFPNAHILIVPNKGYDVGPFIDVLNRVNLREYDYILKVHTKNTTLNNGDKINGRWISRKCWMPLLVESLIGTKKIFDNNLRRFSRHPETGMIASKYLITSSTDSYTNILPQVQNTIKKLGFDIPKKITFVAGTTFMARAHLFLPIVKAGYGIDDFEPTGRTSQGNQLAHVFERVFGALITLQQHIVTSSRCILLQREFELARTRFHHFLFSSKKTNKGTIIKILGIQILKHNNTKKITTILKELFYKKKDHSKKYYFFGIPICSIKHKQNKKVFNICGIKIVRKNRIEYKFSFYQYIRYYILRYVGRIIYCNSIRKNKSKRILVCLHLFYMESWELIKKYLNNLSCYQYDLIVTYIDDNYDNATLEKIKKYKTNVKFYKYENKGFDIGPFIDVLQYIKLEDYDIILKLHSKGIKRNSIFIYNQIFKKKDWFFNLYNGLLDGFSVHKMISAFEKNNNIGIIAADNLIVTDPKHKQFFTEKACKDHGIKYFPNYRFVAGSCFAIRANLLQPIQKLHLSIDNFNVTQRGVFSFAHAMERIICFAQEGKYTLYGIKTKHPLYKKKTAKMLSLSSISLLNDERIKFDYAFFYKHLEGRPILKYEITQIKLGDIRRKFFDNKIYTLEECSPYKYLQGETKRYQEYCAINKQYSDIDMSESRYKNLIASIDKGYDPKMMPIVSQNNIILDGQHRCCILLNKYGSDHKVTVCKLFM